MTLPPFVRLRLSPELEDRKLRELEDEEAYAEFDQAMSDQAWEQADGAWPR